jgi:hypothetical protein
MSHIALFLTISFLTLFPQDDYLSRAAIKSDFDQVTVVARLNVVHVETVETQQGYSIFHITAKVVETYKGSLPPGQEFVYVLRAETGYAIDKYRGQKIIFLNKGQPSGSAEYWSLENSERPPTKHVISILRDLKAKQPGKKT